MEQDALPGPPLARIAVDVPLAHLDHFYDYLVPPAMDAAAQAGARVRVQFSGRMCNGFIIDRPETTDAPGKLLPLTKVVSPEQVLTPAQVELIRAVADRCVGTFADVMRLAVPPRHAATEAAERSIWPEPLTGSMPPGGLLATDSGASWLEAVEQGRPLRAFWAVPPVFDGGFAAGVCQAVIAGLRAGRGVVVLTPDEGALQQVFDAVAGAIGKGSVARLHSHMGVAQRYRNYLAVLRGQARVLVGTRSAVFAPLDPLGLIVMVDDGDNSYIDPHAPYPNARTTALIRVGQAKCALLLAGTARSSEAQQLIERRWLGVIEQPPDQRRASAPAIRAAADETRLPQPATKAIRDGLADGPVLIQVPRPGYLVALTCDTCRTRVECPSCHGPVEAARPRRLSCRWCGRVITGWQCPVCGGTGLRAPVVGSGRTAEELGRAFPGYRVIDSSGDHVVERVGDRPALVVATPGAEPLPDAGYSAAVLMDADRMLMLPDMRAAEQAVRRWFRVIALVRAGCPVCVIGDAQAAAIQALLRVDPGGFAARELAQRREAGLPPARTFVVATSEADTLASLAALVDADFQAFGPVDVFIPGEPPQQRMIWSCEPSAAPQLFAAVKAALALRSAKKEVGSVRVQVDPYEVG